MKLIPIDAAVVVPGDQLEEAVVRRPARNKKSKRARRRLAHATAALRDLCARYEVRDLDAVRRLEAMLAAAAAK